METIRLTPPPHLLEPTPEPVFAGTTNGDLLEWALDSRDALRACNADKRAAGEAVGVRAGEGAAR